MGTGQELLYNVLSVDIIDDSSIFTIISKHNFFKHGQFLKIYIRFLSDDKGRNSKLLRRLRQKDSLSPGI